MPKSKPFTSKETISALLKKMKIYYMNGELDLNRYLLKLRLDKDSAGKEEYYSDGSPVRYVFSWSLYRWVSKRTGELKELEGSGFLFSTEELMDDLTFHGIIS